MSLFSVQHQKNERNQCVHSYFPMWPAEGDSQAKILLYTKAAVFKSSLNCQLTYRQTHFILKGSRRALSRNKRRKVLASSEVCGVALTALVPNSFV